MEIEKGIKEKIINYGYHFAQGQENRPLFQWYAMSMTWQASSWTEIFDTGVQSGGKSY